MNGPAAAPAASLGPGADGTVAFDHDKLAAARFRAVYELPYLAAAMFSLRTVPTTDLPFRTMAVDTQLRLYVDPGFVDDHGVDELAGVLVHEVYHVLFDHSGRAEALGVADDDDYRRWGQATDAAINQVIATTPTRSGPSLPLPDPVLPSHLGFADFPNMTAEMMYLAMTRREARRAAGAPARTGRTGHDDDGNHDGNHDGHDDGHDCGSGAHGAERPWELAASDAGIDGIGPLGIDRIRHRVALAAREHSAVATVGHFPGGFQLWFTELLTPQIDWRRRLAACVRAAIATTMGQVIPTYARPSRRTAATGGVLLPARRAPVVRVAVVIDTSGSMSPQDLGQAVSELAGILRAASVRDRNVRVWACDTHAHEVTLTTDLSALRLSGGGGTALIAGIEAATAERRFHPDLIVILTDGFTAWPDEPPSAAVVVGLIGNEVGTDTPSWAQVVRIEPGSPDQPADFHGREAE